MYALNAFRDYHNTLTLRIRLSLPILDIGVEYESHVGTEEHIDQVPKCNEHESGELWKYISNVS